MSVDTEIFNTSGKKIGEDAKGKDGTVSIVADNDKAKKIEKNYKENGVSSAGDVESGIQTTKIVLNEALDVLKRTNDNGGDKEEMSVVTADGTTHRAATGPAETTVMNGENVVKSSMDVQGEGGTFIHSHPTKISGNVKTELTASTATQPGPGDPASFSNYVLNIIVGNLGLPSIRVDQLNNKSQINPKQGAVFYNRKSQPLLQLNKSALENIAK